MQQWEYVVVSRVKSYGIQYRANGDKQNQWKDQPFHVVLNDMGRAGFELVTYDGEAYIFKRPKAATDSLKRAASTTTTASD